MATAAEFTAEEQALVDEALRRFAQTLREDEHIPTSELGKLLNDMEHLRKKLFSLYSLLKKQEGSI